MYSYTSNIDDILKRPDCIMDIGDTEKENLHLSLKMYLFFRKKRSALELRRRKGMIEQVVYKGGLIWHFGRMRNRVY